MNIIIRRAEVTDAEGILAIYAGPKAIHGTLQIPYPSLETWRKRLADPAPGAIGLVACIDDEIVGNLGLTTSPNSPRRRHIGSIGMAVHDDWHSKGIGTALMQATVDLADRWLNLTRLELDVYVDNVAAIKLYQKFGFVIEGTHVQFAFRDGQYVDTHFMARLRP